MSLAHEEYGSWSYIEERYKEFQIAPKTEFYLKIL